VRPIIGVKRKSEGRGPQKTGSKGAKKKRRRIPTQKEKLDLLRTGEIKSEQTIGKPHTKGFTREEGTGKNKSLGKKKAGQTSCNKET